MGHTGPCCHNGGRNGDYVWQCYIVGCNFRRQCYNDFAGKKHWDGHKGAEPFDKDNLLEVLRKSGASGRRNPQPAAESSSNDDDDDGLSPVPEQTTGVRRSARVRAAPSHLVREAMKAASEPEEDEDEEMEDVKEEEEEEEEIDWRALREDVGPLRDELLNYVPMPRAISEMELRRVMRFASELLNDTYEHLVPGSGVALSNMIGDTMVLARELNSLLPSNYRVDVITGERIDAFVRRVLAAAVRGVRTVKSMVAGN